MADIIGTGAYYQAGQLQKGLWDRVAAVASSLEILHYDIQISPVAATSFRVSLTLGSVTYVGIIDRPRDSYIKDPVYLARLAKAFIERITEQVFKAAPC